MERYKLYHGREVPERQTSNHHINWRQKDYNSPHEKFYRSRLILRLHNPVHSELHREMYPPPKPSRELMQIINNHPLESLEPYERFLEMTAFIGNLALTSWNDERADEAGRIAENYLEQDKYFRYGLVGKVV